MGSTSHRHRCPIGARPGSAGFHAILRPSTNSTTWFSRTDPMVSVMENTSPTDRTRCPGSALAKLPLPSHSGCRVGSAISSNTCAGAARISRDAEATLRSGESINRRCYVARRRGGSGKTGGEDLVGVGTVARVGWLDLYEAHTVGECRLDPSSPQAAHPR